MYEVRFGKVINKKKKDLPIYQSRRTRVIHDFDEKILSGLFLDDERNPQDVHGVHYPDNVKWTIVRTPKEFMAIIKEKKFDIYSFDYYLSAGSITGQVLLAEFIGSLEEDKITDLPIVRFHSQDNTMVAKMSAMWYEFEDELNDRKTPKKDS